MQESTITIPVVEEGGKMRALLPEAFTYSSGFNGHRHDPPPTDRTATKAKGIFPYEDTIGYNWANWGEGDDLPTIIRKKVLDVPMAARAIYQLTQMMAGNGLCYYKTEDLHKGSKVERAYVPEVEDFLHRNRIETNWLPAQLLDYRYYMNCFSELVFSGDRREITGIFHKTAEHCRLSLQNESTGIIEQLYYSPRFGADRKPTSKEIAAIDLYEWTDGEKFLEELTEHKFAWHSCLQTPGASYYAMMMWLGLFRKGGWMDVSAAVPGLINSLQHNQVRLKYHILIPQSYFEIRHPEWNTYDSKKRVRLMQQLIDKINATLSGTKNAYGSIATVFQDDYQNQKPMGRIIIEAVDDKIKNDAWVPSSESADAQIVQGLGLHPSQVGLATQGGKMGAGSGSDQRESFNTGISLNTLEQKIVLEPLNLAARYNARLNPDWGVTFTIDHTHHTTTNNQESGLEPSDTTIEAQ